MIYSNLLDNLISHITEYSFVTRKNTQPFTLNKLKNKFADHAFEETASKESLIEHVGFLPIMAVFLHPYLEASVDLGKVLIMLAIHDIGEIVVGDEFAFTKKNEDAEHIAAKDKLHSNYYKIYQELINLSTVEAKFANSIDKMAPDILGLILGKTKTLEMMTALTTWKSEEVFDKVYTIKKDIMLWSKLMMGINDELFLRFKK